MRRILLLLGAGALLLIPDVRRRIADGARGLADLIEPLDPPPPPPPLPDDYDHWIEEFENERLTIPNPPRPPATQAARLRAAREIATSAKRERVLEKRPTRRRGSATAPKRQPGSGKAR